MTTRWKSSTTACMLTYLNSCTHTYCVTLFMKHEVHNMLATIFDQQSVARMGMDA